MTCIKMGSDDSHSVNKKIINNEGQSYKTMSTNHNFWRERRAEGVSNRGPSAYQPTALPLGQTGSRMEHWWLWFLRGGESSGPGLHDGLVVAWTSPGDWCTQPAWTLKSQQALPVLWQEEEKIEIPCWPCWCDRPWAVDGMLKSKSWLTGYVDVGVKRFPTIVHNAFLIFYYFL